MVNQPRGDSAVPADKLVLAVAVLAVALWVGSPVATKLAVNEIDPVVVGVLRTILAALVAAPAALLLRCAIPKTRSQIALLATSAVGGFVVFPMVYSIGLGLTSAVHTCYRRCERRWLRRRFDSATAAADRARGDSAIELEDYWSDCRWHWHCCSWSGLD